MGYFSDPRRRFMLYTVIGFLVLLGLGYRFYDIFEEMKVTQFFKLIVASHYESAYKMWQAPPSYKYSDFLEDWGDQSFFGGGKIRTFSIERARSKGNFVEIKVRLNGDKFVSLMVHKEDKHFSFKP